jgi:hypothetical protein
VEDVTACSGGSKSRDLTKLLIKIAVLLEVVLNSGVGVTGYTDI